MFGLSVSSTSSSLPAPESLGELLFSNNDISILRTRKANYPVSLHTLDSTKLLVVDGKVYDRSLESLVSEVSTCCRIGPATLDKFLFDLDGEFFVYLIDLNSNTLHIYGDHLNRLPLYYGRRGMQWMVSRDIYHLQSFISSEIDRLNLAEYLVLNYNLENRTLFSNIYSLQIDEYLRVNLSRGEIEVLQRRFSYPAPIESTTKRITPEFIDRMADSFIQSCERRSGSKSVLSLSGGMDSRSVAAGLRRAGVTFVAATFEDEDGTATNDVLIAEEIAKLLNVDWTKIELKNESFSKDVSRAVRFKLGIQPSRLYFLYQYCEKIRDVYGENITFFTGDGGDKVFPDLTSGISFNDNQKLLNHILNEHCEFSPRQASLLVGVSEFDLRDQFRRAIERLPGNNSKLKYEQFILRGRMKRYIFEGEDRNRSFYWSTTPFLSKSFYSLMMSIDRELKADEGLYSLFIARLDPAIGLIRSEKYSRGNIIIGKKIYSFLKNASNVLLSRKYKEYIKSYFKRSRNPMVTAKMYTSEITKYTSEKQLIDMELVNLDREKYSIGQLSLIVTCIYLQRLL